MKIAIIGIGNMGQALINSFINKGAHNPEDIYLYDTDKKKASEFATLTACHFCNTPADAVQESDVLLIAVKPQVFDQCMREVLPSIKDHILIISIAAGICLDKIKGYLEDKSAGIARIMPNAPALIGEGVSALCFLDTTPEMEEYTAFLFGTCGRTLCIEEKKMDAVTGLSGSGPGFVMLFIEALADAGVRNGLTRQESLLLASATVRGSAALVLDMKVHPAQLKDNVCSPGGTTIAGVHVLEKRGFRGTVMDAVSASAARSTELANEKKQD